MTQVAVYIRTSTTDQDGEGQRYECKRVLEQRGVTTWQEYVDRGESGTKASRPQWDRLLTAVRSGDVTHIVTSELSRIGRKLANVILVLDELFKRGCVVTIIKQGLDYSTAAGRLMAQMLAVLAEYERELIADRTSQSLQARKAKGLPIGRPRQLVPRGLIITLGDEGHSIRRIAAELGINRGLVARTISDHRANLHLSQNTS